MEWLESWFQNVSCIHVGLDGSGGCSVETEAFYVHPAYIFVLADPIELMLLITTLRNTCYIQLFRVRPPNGMGLLFGLGTRML